MKGSTNAMRGSADVVQSKSSISILDTTIQNSTDSQPGLMSAADHQQMTADHATLSTTVSRISTIESQIPSGGEAGQVWTSDGSGAGKWADASKGLNITSIEIDECSFTPVMGSSLTSAYTSTSSLVKVSLQGACIYPAEPTNVIMNIAPTNINCTEFRSRGVALYSAYTSQESTPGLSGYYSGSIPTSGVSFKTMADSMISNSLHELNYCSSCTIKGQLFIIWVTDFDSSSSTIEGYAYGEDKYSYSCTFTWNGSSWSHNISTGSSMHSAYITARENIHPIGCFVLDQDGFSATLK